MNLDDQLSLKITLEDRFVPEILRLFNRIRVDFRIGISTGRTVRASVYLSEWDSLIASHYRRVQGAFSGAIISNKEGREPDVYDMILAALLMWSQLHAPAAAAYISKTTQGDMDSAIMNARQAMSDDGVSDYSNRELAMVASTFLNRSFRGRVGTIATTETQDAAESTKLIEAVGISGGAALAVVIGGSTGVTQSTKKWVTMGDKKVRDTHRAANRQTRKLDEPFLVGGYKLKYPGDTSLGAALGEVCNCRCSAQYSIRG